MGILRQGTVRTAVVGAATVAVALSTVAPAAAGTVVAGRAARARAVHAQGGAALPHGRAARATAGAATPGAAAARERHVAAAAAAHALTSGRTRLVVTVDPHDRAATAARGALQRGERLVHVVEPAHMFSLDVPAASAGRRMRELAARAGVRSVHPAQLRSVSYTPNDPDFTIESSYLDAVDAPAAWDVTEGSPSIKIAVVDTGVDVSQPDLAGKVTDTYNVVDGSTDVTDDIGHGTFVAGVAAAATDNAVGVAGAGFSTSLMAVKVADGYGDIYSDDVTAGVYWAVAHGARVINISLGSPDSDPNEQSAVEYALSQGVLVVSAAGNDDTTAPSYPAAYPGVLAVGATDGTGRASFSNYGSWVSVGAPGVNLYSTTPMAGSQLYVPGYDTSSGTSFSSPLVAGEASLLMAAAPSASMATIRTAIMNGTSGSYGFAHGRVDFAAALGQLPPTTTPTIVAPAVGATVSGYVTVTATSSAPRVAVALGPVRATVAAVAGTATTALETYGLSGPQTLTAADCNTAGACGSAVSESVTVANGTPALTAPAQGATVGAAAFTASATASGGGVRFYVDGRSVGFAATSPYQVSVPTAGLSNGAHTLTAATCNAAGTVCDAGHPSGAVAFTVVVLHPTVVTTVPGAFSPNGDRVEDTSTAYLHADQAEKLRVSVRDAAGRTVRGPIWLNSGRPLAAGTYTWVWNGRNNSGVRVPDGRYTVVVQAYTTVNGVTISGSGGRTVIVDTVAPSLCCTTGSAATFYPVRDGFRDTFTPTVHVGERSVIRLYVYAPSGRLARVVSKGWVNPGSVGVTWDGTVGGLVAAAGTYHFTFTATDAAGNRRLTARYAVYVSAKRLVAYAASATYTPAQTKTAVLVGDCSDVLAPAPNTGWTGSYGYYSMLEYYAGYSCDTSADATDLAATEHAFTLPAAIRYGSIRVTATGRSDPYYSDEGVLLYEDRYGNVTSEGKVLGAAYGAYPAPAVTSSWLSGGRTLRWIAATDQSAWYQVRSFRISWTYYRLQ